MNNDIGACHASIRSRAAVGAHRLGDRDRTSAIATLPEYREIRLLIGRGTISVPITLIHVTDDEQQPGGEADPAQRRMHAQNLAAVAAVLVVLGRGCAVRRCRGVDVRRTASSPP